MPPEKRNQFLDTEDSDDDESQNYNSEVEELQKGGRSAKRREIKVADSEKEGFSDEEEVQASEEEDQPKDEARPTQGNEPDAEKNAKSGVVYLSRIPPFMKPIKLRSLLEPYGTINRIFLAPEDSAARTRRVRNSGNKRNLYTEGWVEFVNKKDAKKACELLNARTIGGKKGSYYRDDIWTLLYLKGFKWSNLTEQIAAENAERTSRMRAEISKTARENEEFIHNVERAKIRERIQSKAMGKEDIFTVAAPAQARRRTFDQIPLAKKREREEQPEQVKRVLSKIF